MTIEITEPARLLVARRGFDPVYGARPLRRFIGHEVETRIGRALLGGEILDCAVITIDAADETLPVTWENPPPPTTAGAGARGADAAEAGDR